MKWDGPEQSRKSNCDTLAYIRYSVTRFAVAVSTYFARLAVSQKLVGLHCQRVFVSTENLKGAMALVVAMSGSSGFTMPWDIVVQTMIEQ